MNIRKRQKGGEDGERMFVCVCVSVCVILHARKEGMCIWDNEIVCVCVFVCMYLVHKLLPQLARIVVPHLHKPIHTPRH